MKLKKDIGKKQTVLLLMPSSDYNDAIASAMKVIGNKTVCYVTLNKTFDSLKEILKKKKVSTNNVIFIDAISKSIRKAPDQSDQCYFCKSPSALTEISVTINKFLKHKFDYLIFDSVTNLTTYHDKNAVQKFVQSIANKAKQGETKAFFFALDLKEQEGLIKRISMSVDGVVSAKK